MCTAVLNQLCHCQCHGCFYTQSLLAMPWLFLLAIPATNQWVILLLAIPAGWLLLASSCTFFQTGTVTACAARAATIPPLPCQWFCYCLLLTGTVVAGWLLLSKKFLRHHPMAWAAAMLPPLCHDGDDANTIVPLQCCLACAGLLTLLLLVDCCFWDCLNHDTPSLAVWQELQQCCHHCNMMLRPLSCLC